MKWIKMVNDSSGVMGLREGIGIWSEILLAYLNSWNTSQKYSGISYIEDYPGYLALGVLVQEITINHLENSMIFYH